MINRVYVVTKVTVVLFRGTGHINGLCLVGDNMECGGLYA